MTEIIRRTVNGSTAYTKPLFRLVKCTIIALPWSVRMQSRMKVSMVSRFWTYDNVLPGLKSDEFQICPYFLVVGIFFPGRK